MGRGDQWGDYSGEVGCVVFDFGKLVASVEVIGVHFEGVASAVEDGGEAGGPALGLGGGVAGLLDLGEGVEE